MALLLTTTLAAAEPSRAQDVLKSGDVISGRLRLVKITHFNGTPIRAYQIVVAAPKPLENMDHFCEGRPPKTFHLFVADDEPNFVILKKRLGKTVSVVGDKFFCSENVWQVGDAVVVEWHFVAPDGH
jgi:hypothetical protein